MISGDNPVKGIHRNLRKLKPARKNIVTVK
jgi:hypothetical protein